MQMLPYAVAYIAILIFLIAIAVRFRMWSKMPIHVRWELYPVAHEAKRAHYGGSYLEEFDWWKKPREVSLIGELKVMIPEILFLVALKEHNPKLWIRSFPFHFGLYLVIGCTVLMMGGGVLGALAPDLMAGGLGSCSDMRSRPAAMPASSSPFSAALGLAPASADRPGSQGLHLRRGHFQSRLFLVAFGFALVDHPAGRSQLCHDIGICRGPGHLQHRRARRRPGPRYTCPPFRSFS